MDFTFLKHTGEVAFARSDAESAEWTEEEKSIFCSFPYKADKAISRGMTVLFQGPADNDWQAYIIRNCETYAAEGYQQFTAEDIVITELNTLHIQNDIEITDKTAQQALNQVLSGSGWNVGTVDDNGKSEANINRGSVWRGVCDIQTNWNIHLKTRVTVGANGITGRYIDILPAAGYWRGLRLAMNKNIDDPCVIYDDSDLYTALYGYGASYSEGEGESRVTLDTNFSTVAWSKTADHPAKPSGQRYIEWPEKTALYGINGRPRFGYYQNTNIRDPGILLEKTWESLQACADPKISITGTVADWKRLGYNDVPVRLYDMAIIELEPVGIQVYKLVIKNVVDLLNASKNRPTIGDYIPNIIYINRDTEDIATGGSKGRGGGKGSTRSAKSDSKFKTEIDSNSRNIWMNSKELDVHGNIINQAGMYIDPITGVLIYAEGKDNMIGSMFHVQKNMIETEVHDRTQQGKELSSKITQTANQIALEVSERKSADSALSSRIVVEKDRITQEVSDRTSADNTLSGRITTEAGRITAEVTRATGAENSLSGRLDIQANQISLVVEGTGTNAKIKPASIVAAINDGSSSIKISADHIILDGDAVATSLASEDLFVQNFNATDGEFTGDLTILGTTGIICYGNVKGNVGDFVSLKLEDSGGTSRNVSWKSYSARYCTLSPQRYFLYANSSGSTTPITTQTGRICTEYTDTTISYLGR